MQKKVIMFYNKLSYTSIGWCTYVINFKNTQRSKGVCFLLPTKWANVNFITSAIMLEV